MLQRCFKSNLVKIRIKLDPLEATTAFPYLGCMVTLNNNNLEALYIKLWKAHIQWGLMAMFLDNTGEPINAREMIYKVVFQAVILYGRKYGCSWNL